MKTSIDAYFKLAYETSQTALSFCMFELAVNQNIQEKLRKTINEVLLSHQNRLDYETLDQMVYLDQCVKG
jgi:cytochrome P450 family 6